MMTNRQPDMPRDALGIEVVLAQGTPYHPTHNHSEPLQKDHDAAFARGRSILGDLGYSMLRSEIYGKRRHRARRIEMLYRERADIDGEAAIAERSGNHVAIREVHTDRVMFVWELIGVLAEVCEQLAAVFVARREMVYDGRDFGEAMLAFRTPTDDVFATGEFRDATEWFQALDMHSPLPAAVTSAGSDVANLGEQLRADCRRDLTAALRDVTSIYDHRLHRVAQRRKHAFPLVSGHGLMWWPDSKHPAARRWNEGSSFGVLDKQRGAPVQMLVPSDEAAMNALFDATASAEWLLSSLSQAVLSGAENPTGLPVVFPRRSLAELPQGLLARFVSAYSGNSVAGIEELNQERLSRAIMLEHARDVPSINPRTGRNDPCPCGSGRKYKRCHGVS